MDKLINREVSWLAFNERVLQESLDKNTPLIERLRFLGIYSNNLDEFFRVRMATVNRMIELKNKYIEGFDGSPKLLLSELQKEIKNQRRKYDISYQRILKELEAHQIYHLNEKNIPAAFLPQLEDYFQNELKQDIVPILLDKKRKFPRLVDKEIYLAVSMENSTAKKFRFALIQIPSSHPRFYTIKENDKSYVLILDDIIRLFLNQIFALFKFDKISAYTFKFTRDAELNLDDDISISMYDKMEESIKQRKKGEPVRFIYDENMNKELLNFLKDAIGISIFDHVAPSGRYHNFKDLMQFPDFGIPNFIFPKLPPLTHPDLTNQVSIIKSVLKKDILLHYPYHKFDHLVDLLREAAIDPKVQEIKINIYRVAKRSQVINALINAIKNGKEVTVVMELQARFDEENNMYWSTILREQGAKIIYGVPGLKVHSKLIQITRKTGKTTQIIAHIGTGNFHGGTAKIYTDFGLLTSNTLITKEVVKVFNLLENNIERGIYKQLLVSPFNTRRKFLQLINNEIKAVKKGKRASIDIKINNLVDSKMINKLYEASKAGVKMRLIVRGTCCLIPGVIGLSENIEVRSIVGRFLEHTRFFIFHNDGDPIYLLSSADWMQRNLDKRIEVSAPILDNALKEEVQEIFEMQWQDNVKARIIDPEQKNRYYKDSRSENICFNAQVEIHRYYERKLASQSD